MNPDTPCLEEVSYLNLIADVRSSPFRASEMAQPVKVIASNPDNHGSIPGTPHGGGKKLTPPSPIVL